MRDIIQADKDVGLIVVEVLPISMRLMSTARSESLPDNFCDNLHTILSHHCINTFNLIGHSYGTFLSAHVLHHADLGHRVRSLVLLDPITFLLFHPFLVYNFVYRTPGPWRANEWMIWYFTSRDIGIAALLARQFFWSDGVLWKDDPVLKSENRQTLIVLGGSDQIIPDSYVSKKGFWPQSNQCPFRPIRSSAQLSAMATSHPLSSLLLDNILVQATLGLPPATSATVVPKYPTTKLIHTTVVHQ